MLNNIHPTKTKILEAALLVIRRQGYHATAIDDVCHEAGISKGSFFHHFPNKEALALAAAEFFSSFADGVFGNAPYQHVQDPLDRLLGYVDYRIHLLNGPLSMVTCLLGTMVQETYETHPAIRAACNRFIHHHANWLQQEIEAAQKKYAPHADWSSKSMALYTQAVIQGAFILAKADNNITIAQDCLRHLRRYISQLFPSNS